MLVVNYVHKLQGLDKSLPICLELRERTGAEVISLIEAEPGSHQVDLEAFRPLLEQCSDRWLAFRGVERQSRRGWLNRLLLRWSRRALPGTRLIDHWRLSGKPRKLRKLLREIAGSRQPILMLTIYNGVETAVGGHLTRLVGRRGGLRLGYLKSLHDQGLGLSDLSSRSSNLTATIRLEPCLDALLTPALPAFRELLEAKGVRPAQMVVAGYPPTYRRWHSLMSEGRTGMNNSSARRVVLFTRGEVPHKRAEDQIISDRWMDEAVVQIKEELSRIWPDHRLLIKPHPYQSRATLKAICSRLENVELVETPPCLLAAGASLAIATYSSAILDAVALGVPGIEYYEPTAAFHRLHPDGSPFPAFGVRPAATRLELRTALTELASGRWPVNRSVEDLGSELDLESVLRLANKAPHGPHP